MESIAVGDTLTFVTREPQSITMKVVERQPQAMAVKKLIEAEQSPCEHEALIQRLELFFLSTFSSKTLHALTLDADTSVTRSIMKNQTEKEPKVMSRGLMFGLGH